MTTYENIIVVGGSFAALGIILTSRGRLPAPLRLVIIDPKDTFHHAFSFPRAAVQAGVENEVFIPWNRCFASPAEGVFVNAKVLEVTTTHVVLDREVDAGLAGAGAAGIKTRSVPFRYLIYAAGAKHPSPTSLTDTGGKEAAQEELRAWQRKIAAAGSIVIVGGGGSGVELAAEIRDAYGDKTVTVVHSREKYFEEYGPQMHQAVWEVLATAGVKQVLGQRVVVPDGGFNKEPGKKQVVRTVLGREIEADLVILCTGLTPNSTPMGRLSSSLVDERGYVRVLPTMQVADSRFPNIFAVGDVAGTTDPKTSKSSRVHARTAIDNILKLFKSPSSPDVALKVAPPGPRRINLSMGTGGRAIALELPFLGWRVAFNMSWAARLLRALKAFMGRKGPEPVGAAKTWRALRARV